MSLMGRKRTIGRGTRGDAAAARIPATRFEALIGDRYAELTPAERSIASHLLDNLRYVPFETGATIAAKVGVSEMTVIRFIRSMGYTNLRELKTELRQTLAAEDNELDDVLDRFKVRAGGPESLRESLNLELRAVVKAYELATSERWAAIVALLATHPQVYVTGFQGVKGVALDFATRLKYARAGVRFADGVSGVFSEALEGGPDRSCIVIVDTAAYARKSLLLAEKARDLDLPLVVVTDKFSHWAFDYTELVLAGYTHAKTFWDSTASLSVILNLLINAVAVQLGHRAEQRFELMRQLGDHFKEFLPRNGSARRPRPGK